MIDPPWVKPIVPVLRLGVATKAEPLPMFDDARFKLDAELYRVISQYPFRRLVLPPIGVQKT